MSFLPDFLLIGLDFKGGAGLGLEGDTSPVSVLLSSSHAKSTGVEVAHASTLPPLAQGVSLGVGTVATMPHLSSVQGTGKGTQHIVFDISIHKST